MKLNSQKLERWGYYMVKTAWSTVFDWSTRVTERRTDGLTDSRTDGIAIAYTRYSIYAVARNNVVERVKNTATSQTVITEW